MNKERALKILNRMADYCVDDGGGESVIDNKHLFLTVKYTSSESKNEMGLDSTFTLEELEAIVYWMKHKEEFKEAK